MYLAQVGNVCLDAECTAKQLHAQNIGAVATAIQVAGIAIAIGLIVLAVAIVKAAKERS
jgi:hypothetical protein